VAGGPGLLHPVQHRVAVAVEPDLDDSLFVPGGLALAPQRLAAAAVVVRLPLSSVCSSASRLAQASISTSPERRS
jgi:hypothetical protein